MILTRLASVGFAAAICCGSPSLAQEPNGTRVFRLVPLPSDDHSDRAPMLYPPYLQLGRAAREDFSSSNLPLGDRDPEATFGIDAMTDLAIYLVDPDAERELEISPMDGLLAVRGERADVDRVVDLLGRLQSLANPTVRVEVSLWDVSGGSDRAFETILSAGELASVADQGRLLWRGRTSTRFDRVTQLGSLECRPFVADSEVEVAEESRVGDPRVHSLLTGLMARVLVQPAVKDDEIVVFGDLMFNRATIGDRFYSLGLDLMGALDAPRLHETRTAVSARIENGGALAIWSIGESSHSPTFALTIRVDRDPIPEFPEIRVVPTIGLRTNRLLSCSVRRPSHEDERFIDFASNDPVHLLRGATAAAIETVVDYGDPDLVTFDVERYQIFEADRPEGKTFEEMLRGFEELYHRNVQIDLTTRVRMFDRTGRGDAGASQVWDRLVVPSLASRVAILRRGSEATEVSDFEVEIAKKSQARNPNVTGVFSGVFASVQLLPELDGTFRGAVVGDVHEAGDAHRQALGDEKAGDLWLFDKSSSPLRWSGRVELPQTVDFGDAFLFELDEERYALQTSLTLR